MWKDTFKTWPYTPNQTYVIEDLSVPEFDVLLKSKDKAQIGTFAAMISKFWTGKFEEHNLQKPNCAVKDTEGNILTTTHSSFYLQVTIPISLFGKNERWWSWKSVL